MVGRERDFPSAAQGKSLRLSRGGLCDRKRPLNTNKLEAMRRIFELRLEYRAECSLMPLDLPRDEGRLICQIRFDRRI